MMKSTEDQTDLELLKAIKIKGKSLAHSSDVDFVSIFPFEVYPEKLQNLITSASDAFGIDSSFLGGAFLFAYSLAIGKSHVLELKKKQYMKCVLYMANVGRPSINKSASLDFVLAPFNDLEKKENIDFQKREDEYLIWKDSSKEERNGELKTEPQLVQYLLGDATMEAIVLSHKYNQRGIAMYRDELAGLFKDLNKYRPGSDMENYLTNWSGGKIKVNRSTKKPTLIDNPFIGVGGSIQPMVLRGMAKIYLKEGAGFIDRFLFIYPDNLEKALYTENEIDEYLLMEYHKSINTIIELPLKIDKSGDIESHIVGFTPEAKQKIIHWFNFVNKPKTDNAGDILAGIYGKFDIHLLRVCLILHFIKWSFGESEGKEKISLDTVLKSIKIIDFFRSHTDKVQTLLSNNDSDDILEDHELKLYKALPECFTFQDGVSTAEKFGKKRTVFSDFLNRFPELFEKVKHGTWKKIK